MPNTVFRENIVKHQRVKLNIHKIHLIIHIVNIAGHTGSIKGNAGRLETPYHVLSYVDISKLEKYSKTGLYKLNSIPFELVLKENLYEPKYSDFTTVNL